MRQRLEIRCIVSCMTESTLFSLICISALLLCLQHYELLYSFGKISLWPVIIALIIEEVIRAALFNNRVLQLTKKDLKLPKTKSTRVKVRDIFKFAVIIISATSIFYIVAVLFGAPLCSEQEETFMFSVLMTVLTVFPLVLHLGIDTTYNILKSATINYETDILAKILTTSSKLTLLGSWLGAIVIPLDWDRPWQVWPVPCSLGSLLGFIISEFLILLLHMPRIRDRLISSSKYNL